MEKRKGKSSREQVEGEVEQVEGRRGPAKAAGVSAERSPGCLGGLTSDSHLDNSWVRRESVSLHKNSLCQHVGLAAADD